MPDITPESFEGFPQSTIRIDLNNAEMQQFLLRTTGIILDGEGNTPEATREYHTANIQIGTDIEDPKTTGHHLAIELTLPVTEAEYHQILRPNFEDLPEDMLERNPWDTLSDLDDNPEVMDDNVVNEPSGTLAMFIEKPAVIPASTEPEPEPERKINFAEHRDYLQNMTTLARMEFLDQVADTLPERVRFDDFVDTHGVELDGERPKQVTAATSHARIQFVGKHENYPFMADNGVSSKRQSHGNYFSPFTQQRYTTTQGSSFYDESTIQDREQWAEAVHSDMAVIQQEIRLAAQRGRDNITELFEYAHEPHPLPKTFTGIGLVRTRHFFEGWQQFAHAGHTLLTAHQEMQWLPNGEYRDNAPHDIDHQRVSLTVTEKKSDESRPIQIRLATDTEPEADVQVVVPAWPGPSHYSDLEPCGYDGIYTGGLDNHVPGEELSKYTIQAMRNSHMTDADIQDAVEGKRWGLKPNPFSHREFYAALNYLDELAQTAEQE